MFVWQFFFKKNKVLPQAMRYVRSAVNLLVEQEQRKNMVEELMAALANKGADGKNVMIVYDQKAAGEPITAPHIRIPPLRSERLKRSVHCSLEALGLDNLGSNVVVAVADGGSLGNKTVT